MSNIENTIVEVITAKYVEAKNADVVIYPESVAPTEAEQDQIKAAVQAAEHTARGRWSNVTKKDIAVYLERRTIDRFKSKVIDARMQFFLMMGVEHLSA